MPSQECYLEYMWGVAPGVAAVRRSFHAPQDGAGPAQGLGVHTVRLYVLDGNKDAMRLYERFGFERMNERQLLPDHPAGSEELMRLRLI